jgi:hypothetical protein
MKTVPKSVRCAIYTRKSTEQGLEQDFNSLDAQYEASRAGRCFGQNTMMAASPVATLTALPYSASLRMFKRARSTSSSSTKSID